MRFEAFPLISPGVSKVYALLSALITPVGQDRQSPNGSRAGALALQAWRANDGEGQALALREGKAFFTAARRPSDATRASERVSPANVARTAAHTVARGTGPREAWCQEGILGPLGPTCL